MQASTAWTLMWAGWELCKKDKRHIGPLPTVTCRLPTSSQDSGHTHAWVHPTSTHTHATRPTSLPAGAYLWVTQLLLTHVRPYANGDHITILDGRRDRNDQGGDSEEGCQHEAFGTASSDTASMVHNGCLPLHSI